MGIMCSLCARIGLVGVFAVQAALGTVMSPPDQSDARYQLGASEFIVNGKKVNVGIKLDRFSGRTWRFDGGNDAQWKLIPEQKELGKPSVGGVPRYQLTSFCLAKDRREELITVRYDRFGGRTWKLDGVKDSQWEAIPEQKNNEEPKASDSPRYEFATHNFTKSGREQEIYLRFDRFNGQTWKFDAAAGAEWMALQEQKTSEKPGASDVARYQLACYTFSEAGRTQELYLRLDAFSGRTWKLDGGGTEEWAPIPEQDGDHKPARGDVPRYQLDLIRPAKDGVEQRIIVRFDRQTGKGWRWGATEPGWIPVKQPAEPDRR